MILSGRYGLLLDCIVSSQPPNHLELVPFEARVQLCCRLQCLVMTSWIAAVVRPRDPDAVEDPTDVHRSSVWKRTQSNRHG